MQSNDNCDGLTAEEKFKFIDDLSILEVINLLTVGISSYFSKLHVPNDIASDNGYIASENLKTQDTINKISEWTKVNKMLLNQKKIILKSTCSKPDYQ